MRPALAGLLAAHFPVSRPLGVRVREASPRRVILDAPLAPNRNRSGTAFAGSRNALATRGGWAGPTLHLGGEGQDPEVVLQDSSITYHKPAASAFRAVCVAPEAGNSSASVPRSRGAGGRAPGYGDAPDAGRPRGDVHGAIRGRAVSRVPPVRA
ncbi:MAG: YiiD C-terminal domain-containing protein [Gemmatimonadetes bacterium]|nr:YiiD C-terminal domain-containing protein [Gemmatimonadota bacterium]